MRRAWVALAVAAALLSTLACGGGGGGSGDQQSKNAAINSHIQSLSYDPAELLGVRSISSAEERSDKQPVDLPDETDGPNLIVCAKADHNLQRNVEEVAILRPTNGVIWPGALVKANAGLMEGLPEPITLAPAPITLRVDLPGMGENGTFIVTNPSNSAVQAKLNAVLESWHATNPGYTNPANQSYDTATSFSSEQLALDLGLNVKWAGGAIATQMSTASTTKSTVAMMVYKQVFYNVTLDTPSSPAAMFADSVATSAVTTSLTASTPPAYVHSVAYGRILVFRMETSEAFKSTDVEAAFKYAGGVKVEGEAAAHYENILQKSSISLVTVGGNADAAAQGVNAKTFGELVPIITENATYTRDNPGVPIAYTVKFLKDNVVAKMGYTTDYTSTECSVMKPSAIGVTNKGTFTARAYLKYTPRGGTERQDGSGNLGGWGIGGHTWNLAAGAMNVTLITQVCTLPWPIETWREIGRKTWSVPPEHVVYCLSGETWSAKMGDCTP